MPGKSGRIAIAGAGMTGAYLYRRLKNEGCEAALFDPGGGTACGLTPCAWGTSAGFAALVAAAGLRPEEYLLHRMDHLAIEELRVRVQLATFDKPALIRDLLGGAEIRTTPIPAGSFDRIIDATGTARAFLPPLADDVLLDCCQYLVESDVALESQVRIERCGYAWCFPLSGSRYHVGCGALLQDPSSILRATGWHAGGEDGSMRPVCGCSGRIRMTGPHRCTPFVMPGNPPVWGIGESIGCVAPLVGDGVVPGMRSVELLLEHWDDPVRYRDSILAEFDWMRDEREVVDALKRGAAVGVREARVLLRNARRMQLRLGTREVLGILRILAEKYLLPAQAS